MNRILTLGAAIAVAAAGLPLAPVHAASQPVIAASRAISTKADPHFTPRERAIELRSARAHAAATAAALRLGVGQLIDPFDALRDTTGGTHVRYERTFRGLRVVGGDLVVHRSKAGDISSVDYAHAGAITLSSIRPRVVAPADRSNLVVFASNHRPVLAWETRLRTVRADGDPIDRLTYANARTGKKITS
jgi:hypothetical protein